MTTLERPREEIRAPITAVPEKRSPGVLLIAAIAVLALVLGGAIGWMIRGDGATEPDSLLAGAGEVTARHEQMVEFLDGYNQAWRDGDVEAIRTMYVPEGTFTVNGVSYAVAGPEFADYLGLGAMVELVEPQVVRGRYVLSFGRLAGTTYMSSMTFTMTGELLLTSQEVSTGDAADGIASASEAGIVLVGDGELTTRHQQMLDTVRAGAQAWRDGDVDAVLAGFTPDGTFEAFGNVYRVDDGSLAAFLERASWSSLDVQEPVLVRGNEMLTFHRVRGQDLSETFTFTETGELLITSHVIHTGGSTAGAPTAPAIVLAGDGELTARQQQMVDFMEDYELAWRDGDVEALESMYVETGRFTAFGTEYDVDAGRDAPFARFVGSGRPIDVLEPVVVNGSRLLNFHTHGSGTYRNLMRFTTDGELLLVSHEIVN